jgi:hypothetical protein
MGSGSTYFGIVRGSRVPPGSVAASGTTRWRAARDRLTACFNALIPAEAPLTRKVNAASRRASDTITRLFMIPVLPGKSSWIRTSSACAEATDRVGREKQQTIA